MRRSLSQAHRSLAKGERVAIDTDVPRGCAPVMYEIDGFDTAFNPLARKINGRRMRQTSLPIVFNSGLVDSAPDGVSVEAILAVCQEYLQTKAETPAGKASDAKANAHIRKALDILTHQLPAR